MERKTVNFVPAAAANISNNSNHSSSTREPVAGSGTSNSGGASVGLRQRENQENEQLSSAAKKGLTVSSAAPRKPTRSAAANESKPSGGRETNSSSDGAGNNKRERSKRSGSNKNRSSGTSDAEQLKTAAALAGAESSACCDPLLVCFHRARDKLMLCYRRMVIVPVISVTLTYILPFSLETAILALHFQELHSLPDGIPFYEWDLFPRQATFVVALFVFGILLSARFLIGALATKTSLWRYLVSPYGVVSILTIPMMFFPGMQFYIERKQLYVDPWLSNTSSSNLTTASNASSAISSNMTTTSSPNNISKTLLLRGTTFPVLNRSFTEQAEKAINAGVPSWVADAVNDSVFFSVPSISGLRIWIVYDIMQTIIFASSTVSKSFRAILFQLLSIFCIIFTCTSTIQLIFCIEQVRFFDIGTSFYYSVVTLTTVGFGDFVPTSILGRAFIISQIFVALLAIPVLLSESERLLKFLDSLTGYSGSDRHIIVFGDLTQAEFEGLLTERQMGDGRDDPLHVVFVASSFTQEQHDFVNRLPNADSFTLCVATQLSRSELLRFSPHRADAALFFSSSSAAALRGDYRTIAAAASLKLHHPSVPQYLLLRRTSTAHLVEGAYVVFDRDFLRAALLGTSLQMPGFLPMFLNLIRFVPSKTLEKNPDNELRRQHQRRLRQQQKLQRVMDREKEVKREIAAAIAGSASGAAANSARKKASDRAMSSSSAFGAGAAAAGRSAEEKRKLGDDSNDDDDDDDSDGNYRDDGSSSDSNDEDAEEKIYAYHNSFGSTNKKKRRRLPNTWYGLYLAGARQNIYTITVPEVLVGRTFVVAAFIVQLRTGATPIGLVRDSKVALNAGATSLTASDSLVVIASSWDELFHRFSKFPATSMATNETAVTRVALRNKDSQFETQTHSGVTAMWLASTHNCFPFQNHVILIDLASFLSRPELCPEECFQREQFQVQDLLALASRFPKWQSFVLLSLSPISNLLQAQWAASGRQPIFHVRKSPLDPEALKLCRIGSCMSVLIFSSLHLADENDAEFKSASLTVNRRVMDAVRAEMLIQNAQAWHKQEAEAPGSSGDHHNSNKKKTKTPKIWPHPNIISVIASADEALLLSPEHLSYPGETLDHDAHCAAFATGCGLCPTLLDGLLFRTYYNEYLPQIVELMLEPGAIRKESALQLAPALFELVKDAVAASVSEASDAELLKRLSYTHRNNNSGSSRRNSTRPASSAATGGAFAAAAASSAPTSHPDHNKVTFGQLCRVCTAAKIICFGFSRVIDTPERGAETVGKVFFVTNPDLATPVHEDDLIFYLPTWSPEKLAREFFS